MSANTNLAEQLLQVTRDQSWTVCIIGDTMTDVWISGNASPCQDGCLKVVKNHKRTTPGGAANAANCLINWTNVCAQLFGAEEGERPVKHRITDQDNKIIARWDDEKLLNENVGKFIRNRALEMVKWADAVLISDYDKGLLTPEFIKEIVNLCTNLDIPCVADCKRSPELYGNAILKGNSAYYAKYAEEARRKDTQVVTTYGEYPPVVWDKGKLWSNRPLPAVKCINHVGAGDCFAAHLALALGCGFTLEEASAISYSAGRIYVQRRYNHPPTPLEIIKDMQLGSVIRSNTVTTD